MAALVFATFDAYAISNDEAAQQHYGELIVAYYLSGFADQSLFHYDNLYLYGGLFDVLAVFVQHLIPFVDAYDLRHILCALTGIGGIAAAFATARLVAGPRAGAIAAFALAACGPWYGGMFNHTKDIPFAAAMMGATYFLLRALRTLPRPRGRDVICFGLLLGAALGLRVLGLLMIGYAGLALAIGVLSAREGSRLRLFAQAALAFAPAFIIAYAIMIAAWPWAALAPLNPLRGLIDFGHFHYQIKTLLAGEIYTMGEVPRWYVPAYLLIKLPLLILIGAGFALVLPVRGGQASRRDTALLAFMAVFPVLCEVIDRGPAFTGLRHFLFVVPVLAVLAGIGLDRLLDALAARRMLMRAAGAAVVAALAWNAGMLLLLHPYQYLFYNPLVGGLEGASRRYATDYWVNIMPEAVADLSAYLAKSGNAGSVYSVAVCGEKLPFEKEASAHLRWADDWRTADFFIAPTHMDCDRALNGAVIATIRRLGVPIGVVKDRRAVLRAEIASHWYP